MRLLLAFGISMTGDSGYVFDNEDKKFKEITVKWFKGFIFFVFWINFKLKLEAFSC